MDIAGHMDGSLALPAGEAQAGAVRRLAAYLTLPVLMWVALWFSINTGPWVLARGPVGLIQWLHALRAFFPLAILLLSLGYIAGSRGPGARAALPKSLKLWAVYGLVALFSSSLSASPGYAAYWALAYLGAIAGLTALLRRGDPLERAVQANYLTWVVATAFLLTMVVLARDALFADPHSGYGVLGRQSSVVDMPMSRATGLARFAAVPGIVGLGYALCRRGTHRVLGGLMFAVSFGAFIYYLQSRGAIFGFAGAAVVVMLLAGVRGKALLAAIALTAICAWFAQAVPVSVWAHATRGETTWEQLRDFTGRVGTWQEGWNVFLSSPIIGLGSRADRLLGVGEIHNTWMSALLQAGLVGAVLLLAGLLRAWTDVWRVAKSAAARRAGQRTLFAQAGGILAFFTLRGIVEQCGSLFNVDLLVMLPAMAYVGILPGVRTGPQSRTARLRCREARHSSGSVSSRGRSAVSPSARHTATVSRSRKG